MRTDTIFYQLFKTLPELLFELIGKPKELANNYEFKSVEVKELSRRIDGVFFPKENINQPIYFLEVQFQKDSDLYWRLITELMMYLGQYKPQQDCQAVVLWAKRSFDPGLPLAYQNLFKIQNITILYLDELEETNSFGLGIVKLIVSSEKEAKQQVKTLLSRANSEIENTAKKREMIELIEKMLVYKFPKLSYKELEKMFGLTEWKQTKFYQEVKLEGKLETIPRLLKLGLTVEQIAQALELDIELVKKAASASDN